MNVQAPTPPNHCSYLWPVPWLIALTALEHCRRMPNRQSDAVASLVVECQWGSNRFGEYGHRKTSHHCCESVMLQGRLSANPHRLINKLVTYYVDHYNPIYLRALCSNISVSLFWWIAVVKI